MNERIKQFLLILLVIAGAIGGYSVGKTVFENLTRTSEPSNYAKMETIKNGFMSGCTNAKQDFLTLEQQQNFCQCAWDKLYSLNGNDVKKYEELNKRVQTSGYSIIETNMIAQCLEPYME